MNQYEIIFAKMSKQKVEILHNSRVEHVEFMYRGVPTYHVCPIRFLLRISKTHLFFEAQFLITVVPDTIQIRE